MTWALVLQGGAQAISVTQAEANRQGCLEALAAGRALRSDATPQETVRSSLAQFARVGSEVVGIALERHGPIGGAQNSSHYAVAWMTEGMEAPCVRLHQGEE